MADVSFNGGDIGAFLGSVETGLLLAYLVTSLGAAGAEVEGKGVSTMYSLPLASMII